MHRPLNILNAIVKNNKGEENNGKKQEEKRSKYDGDKLSREAFIDAYNSGESDFSGADLSGIDLHDCYCVGKINLSWADLSNAILSDNFLKYSIFDHACLDGASIHGSQLNEINVGASFLFAQSDDLFLKK